MRATSFEADREPSYFYFMMAKSSFRRTAATAHPHGRSTLREIGRDYLAKSLPSCDQTGDSGLRR